MSSNCENDNADSSIRVHLPESYNARGEIEKFLRCRSLGIIQRSTYGHGEWHLEGAVSLHWLQKKSETSSEVEAYISDAFTTGKIITWNSMAKWLFNLTCLCWANQLAGPYLQNICVRFLKQPPYSESNGCIIGTWCLLPRILMTAIRRNAFLLQTYRKFFTDLVMTKYLGKKWTRKPFSFLRCQLLLSLHVKAKWFVCMWSYIL